MIDPRHCDTCGGPATHRVWKHHGRGDYLCGSPVCRKNYESGEHFVLLPPLCKSCEASGFAPAGAVSGHEGMCLDCRGMGVEDDSDPCGGLL